MKGNKVKPGVRVSDLGFYQFYDDISRDWQGRADRLRKRRWKQMMDS